MQIRLDAAAGPYRSNPSEFPNRLIVIVGSRKHVRLKSPIQAPSHGNALDISLLLGRAHSMSDLTGTWIALGFEHKNTKRYTTRPFVWCTVPFTGRGAAGGPGWSRDSGASRLPAQRSAGPGGGSAPPPGRQTAPGGKTDRRDKRMRPTQNAADAGENHIADARPRWIESPYTPSPYGRLTTTTQRLFP